MPATKIDGKTIAASIREEIKKDVEAILNTQEGVDNNDNRKRKPGLAVIIVGTRGDSQTYVRLKKKAALECLFHSVVIELPDDISNDELIAHVQKLNGDETIHGILVQLPLPKHIDESKVVDSIDPQKDVDGLHPVNVGALYLRGRTPYSVACTPQGVIQLLKRSGVAITGKRAVVLGRSNIVGLPVAQLLMQENATVTTVHSKSENIPAIVREADIVVAAVGQAAMVKGDWIKPGAVVIDVGTNPIPDPSKESGTRLVGDVDFEAASQNASMITPVPGGVGPMTIAMLLTNTLASFKRVYTSKKAEAAAAASEEEEGEKKVV